METTNPSLARMYDFTLGGSQHIEADRDAVRRMRELAPELADSFWANHAFTQRAASLIAERGVRQFLDIGAGLLGDTNVHDVVRESRADAVVAYVDHDAEVVEYGKRSLEQLADIAFVRADLRDPDLLRDPALAELFDFTEPLGVLVVGVLDYLADEDDPVKTVRRITDQLPEGSYLALSHLTAERMAEERVAHATRVLALGSDMPQFRDRAEVTRFFEGCELEPPYPGARPGVNYIGLWGAEDPAEADDEAGRWWYAGIARKASTS